MIDQIDTDFRGKLTQPSVNLEEKLSTKTRPDPKIEEITRLQAAISFKEELEALAAVADDFGIGLPIAEIRSINIFSDSVHTQYFAPTVEDQDSAQKVLSLPKSTSEHRPDRRIERGSGN